MTGPDHRYEGSELELFALAHRWKAYLATELGPYVGGDVLEVGSGIGSMTRALAPTASGRWTALEPDQHLSQTAAKSLDDTFDNVTHVVGTTVDILERPMFDTVLYVDVLEHIDDDRGELERAARLLRPAGRLVVLAPAHQSLFSPFDRAVGHHRRYGRTALTSLTPPGTLLHDLRFLDSAGLVASAANRFVLRSSLPTGRQVATWDRLLIPFSTWLDPLLFHRVGKSILAVWRRQGG